MDSINQNQPEDNFQNLEGAEANKKIKELAETAKSCFFITNIKTGIPLSVRPMSIQKIDDEGNFWFLSAKDSHKNEEIGVDPFVHLLFQGSAHSDFLNIYGLAEISDDKEKIKELWEPILKTWFTEGEDDPRISVVKVEPTEGYYWDNKHGNAVAFAKQTIGAVLGKTLDDSIEGKLVL
ncbi:pyridoxamine 5'-phosphate oxidase family protein [Mucilaginibacter sp. KACC 22063]|uniref:pyridoxamine 5'-phosphate oxidase family protein n=1 Tax=Mucilaginibacter sp. KACC 22063 TaxID=3025666 RepID=UPI00236704F3|nr:pyridoxamine 5'-phosphate oxidase family protein [Mucilaginibacter sp. KACC 22063]WDF54093.1 pyridoxamine 5'-phosphate oxidase family protein [Mucilaginibacter sp. KACC 22063]